MTFDSDKFIQAKIMQLIEPDNPKNFRFTIEFENAAENKLSEINGINDTFRNVALAYAKKSGVSLTDIEIEYALDLYVGINPWTKTSHGANQKGAGQS